MNTVGSIALMCDPYCYVLDNVNCGYRCDDCFSELDPNKKVKCNKCKYTYYCDDKCKSHSWDEIHDVECEFLKSYNPRINPVDVKVRLWARLLIRNYKGFNNVTHYFEENKSVTFDTLNFPFAALKETCQYEQAYKEDCLQLAQYFISKPEMITRYSQDYLETMYLRMRYATIKLRKDPFEMPVIGFGIYLVATLIRLKCQANSIFKFNKLRLTSILVEEIPQLRSITQVTVGRQAIFGFTSQDNLIREYLDCGCDACRVPQIELVKCQNSRCNKPFLWTKKFCPECHAKLKPKFLKKYIKLRSEISEIVTNKYLHEQPESFEAAKKVFQEFDKLAHICNTVRLRLITSLFKTIPNRERVLQLEFFGVYYGKVHGYYDLSRISCLVRLTQHYCHLCDTKKLIQLHGLLRQILPVVASVNHPYYIQNEYMLNKVTDISKNLPICRCVCKDIEEYLFF